MNDFAASLLARQNERELAVALERRRLLHEGRGTDPRFRTKPALWHRLQASFRRSAAAPAAPGRALHSRA